jgi:thioredoxin-dependent peroxiredoxin
MWRWRPFAPHYSETAEKGVNVMTKLGKGQLAPDFTLATDAGTDFTLSAARGKPVVLFFYPQDDTEGCTMENMEFSALKAKFDATETLVVGISPDSVRDHREFSSKYGLEVLLAADPHHQAISLYGVWGPKKTFGREYVGLIRTTFLVAPDGRLADIWTVTRVKGHAATVLEAAKTLVSDS